ncbi:LysR family transcriptional regulator, partial [Escherichia coli]|nr:LysR family transcriptional regulator [Escherichia coli]
PGFFDYTRRIFDRAGYAPTYVEEPAEHDVLLARIARGEGMILLPASFSAIQRQGVAFCPVAEGDAMPLSLGVIYPPHQAESVQQWLSLL